MSLDLDLTFPIRDVQSADLMMLKASAQTASMEQRSWGWQKRRLHAESGETDSEELE